MKTTNFTQFKRRSSVLILVVGLSIALFDEFISLADACIATTSTPETTTTCPSAECSDQLTSFSNAELTKYISTYDSSTDDAGKLVNFGTKGIVENCDGTYAVTCQCSGEGDTCYLEFAGSYPMLLGHMVQSYESSNNGNGVYDLITSGTISCDTNFDSYLTDFGQYVEKYACYSYAHTQCSESMSSLSQSQLNTYLAEYDDVPAEARTLQNFGTVEFVPTSGGFQVTCQCAGSGDTCYLEFAKNNNQFLNKNTISETKPNKGAGTYNLITSAEITCDANGNNILNGQEIGKYACYSALNTNCESRLSKLSRGKVEEYNSVYNGVPGQEGVIRSLGGTEEVTRNDGFIETCKCSGAGDFCVFEFAGSFDDFLLKNTISSAVENNGDNTYDLIRSPKITCDENGNNILRGQIVKKYTCYAVTFTN